MMDLNIGLGSHLPCLQRSSLPVLPTFETVSGALVASDLTGAFAVEVIDPAPYAGLYETALDGTPLATSLIAEGPVALVAPRIALGRDLDGSGGLSVGDTISIRPGLSLYDADALSPEIAFALLADGAETGVAGSTLEMIVPATAAGKSLSVRQTITQDGRGEAVAISEPLAVAA